jgi:hypothetical protein
LEPLFDQCRSLLEQWVIPAPVIGVTLSIPATAPLAADQGDLLVPSWRDAAMNADAVFTRLRAVLDPENTGDIIVHPVAGDAHRPEEAGRWERADAMALGATVAAKSSTAAATAKATATTTTATAAANDAKAAANGSSRGQADGIGGLDGIRGLDGVEGFNRIGGLGGDGVGEDAAGDTAAHGRESLTGREERHAARGLGLHRVGAGPLLLPNVHAPNANAPNANAPNANAPNANAHTPAVLRLFDAPESIEVEEAAGVPDACWWRGRRLSFSAIDGPERLSGDWWRIDAFARDYWRCTVASEGELLLYRDAGVGLMPRWFVQGWYD